MAKFFRLACSIKSYLDNEDKTHRPAMPNWLTLDLPIFPTYAQKRSKEYWTQIYWATPPWISERMIKSMKRKYLNARKGYHVDHVVPLKSSIVCGLHVPWNLEVIPDKQNLAKSNDMWPGHPCENAELFNTDFEPYQMRLVL